MNVKRVTLTIRNFIVNVALNNMRLYFHLYFSFHWLIEGVPVEVKCVRQTI